MRLLLAVAISVALWLSGPLAAKAAEVLQVRTSTLLQVGDGNRNYSVQLACIQVDPGEEAQAIGWLRAELPRRSRVNLRPMGQDHGVLLASVQKLGATTDLATGLVAEGFAQASCGASTTING